MTLDDFPLQPTHLTVVAWHVSDRSDTLVSSLFWLPLAACWSWCVFQPWPVSVPCKTDCNSVWQAFLLPPQNPCRSRKGHNFCNLAHSPYSYSKSFPPEVFVCFRSSIWIEFPPKVHVRSLCLVQNIQLFIEVCRRAFPNPQDTELWGTWKWTA